MIWLSSKHAKSKIIWKSSNKGWILGNQAFFFVFFFFESLIETRGVASGQKAYPSVRAWTSPRSPQMKWNFAQRFMESRHLELPCPLAATTFWKGWLHPYTAQWTSVIRPTYEVQMFVKGVLHPWTLFLKTLPIFSKNKATLEKVSNGSDYKRSKVLKKYCFISVETIVVKLLWTMCKNQYFSCFDP